MTGYKQPPKQTRWKKGQSGNPSGRPKGAQDYLAAVMKEMAETIQITEGGKTKRITKLQALIKALTAGGIKGDTRAAHILIGLCARMIETNPEAQAIEGVTAADQKIVDDYLERQVELGVAKRLETANEPGRRR